MCMAHLHLYGQRVIYLFIFKKHCCELDSLTMFDPQSSHKGGEKEVAPQSYPLAKTGLCLHTSHMPNGGADNNKRQPDINLPPRTHTDMHTRVLVHTQRWGSILKSCKYVHCLESLPLPQTFSGNLSSPRAVTADVRRSSAKPWSHSRQPRSCPKELADSICLSI
jgi:hypothetical protein